ncbi:hypothetical protein J2736_001513 [Paenibacillus qinlingensis]|uniref:Uncharacterized protein n=1 Tax=Paenibacillus qinlingensis TaxID=1837343 RepID=A0ABU1NS73_9BACL|nr:hypothetical protein [Paenibacillus qinlingensis]
MSGGLFFAHSKTGAREWDQVLVIYDNQPS